MTFCTKSFWNFFVTEEDPRIENYGEMISVLCQKGSKISSAYTGYGNDLTLSLETAKLTVHILF